MKFSKYLVFVLSVPPLFAFALDSSDSTSLCVKKLKEAYKAKEDFMTEAINSDKF